MNWFEVMKSAFKPFLDDDKPPLHVGEVMNLWYFLAIAEQTTRGEQVAYNIVQNEELRKHILDLREIHLDIQNKLIEFLEQEGVPLPRTTAPKNEGRFTNIPDDAKSSDEEAALLVSENLYLAINMAARGISEAIRPDVGAMFAQFFMQKVSFGITFKDFLRKQGWLLVPPAFNSEMIRSQPSK